jgi:hypothetical protein
LEDWGLNGKRSKPQMLATSTMLSYLQHLYASYALVTIQWLLITGASSSDMTNDINDAVYRMSNKKGPHSLKILILVTIF